MQLSKIRENKQGVGFVYHFLTWMCVSVAKKYVQIKAKNMYHPKRL